MNQSTSTLAVHHQLFSACSQQVQALTDLARSCRTEDKQPTPVERSRPKGVVTPALTEDQIDALEVLYEHGHSLRDIAKKAKRSRMTVLRRLQERGVKRRPKMAKKLSPEQVTALATRYRQGEPANLLARKVGGAVTTVVRYLKAEGVAIRGNGTSASTFNEEVFRRRDSPVVQYFLGYLSSPRCEVSEPGDDAWLRIRFPFAHEEKVKALRRLLEAPQDTKRVRAWETLDSIVLRVQSLMLVELLHDVGIVPDESKRVCKVRDLFFSQDYWRGLIDAVGVVEAGKLSVKAGPLLAVQLLQYIRTLVPEVGGKIAGDWLIIQGDVVEEVVRAIYRSDVPGRSPGPDGGNQAEPADAVGHGIGVR